MKNKVAKRGRSSKFDDFWKQVVEWRLEGLFIPAIAKKLRITKAPIYAWLEKGKHNDQEKKYQLFWEEPNHSNHERLRRV